MITDDERWQLVMEKRRLEEGIAPQLKRIQTIERILRGCGTSEWRKEGAMPIDEGEINLSEVAIECNEKGLYTHMDTLGRFWVLIDADRQRVHVYAEQESHQTYIPPAGYEHIAVILEKE